MRRPPITPLRLPRGVRTVVVFGGSFDPPHVYHALAPFLIQTKFFAKDGWVLYVPAAQSPLKGRGPVASDMHRLAMLKRALDIPAPRSIWTDEIDRAAWLARRGRSEPSYTIDTLRRLRTVVPKGVTLRLLIGADQAANFHEWKDARSIITLAEPLVLAREPIVTVSDLYVALDSDFWTRDERVAWSRRMAPNVPIPAASTTLRDAIPGAPKNVARWSDHKGLQDVIDSVAQYIIDHNLYSFRKGPTKPASASAIRERGIDGDGPVGRRLMAKCRSLNCAVD